ncbi:MAG: hypothetical protein R3344_12775, partial [Acidobacteriota bacterium]|nr:hypothetical protein [Acidobacteriota bacterium]
PTPVIEATQYISREEIEKALGKRPGDGETDPETDDSEIDYADDEFEQTVLETQDDGVPADIPDPVEDDWDPPLDLERLISRFNEMQRVVYRSIRTEVGAGAGNFVRSCGTALDGTFGELFQDVRLGPDGAWDPDDLRRAVHDRRVDEPWSGFQELIDQEIAKLQTHIGRARAESLRERLAALDGSDGAQTARPPE